MSRIRTQVAEAALGVECAWPAAAQVAPRAVATAPASGSRPARRLAATLLASALLVGLIVILAGTADLGAVLPAGFPLPGN